MFRAHTRALSIVVHDMQRRIRTSCVKFSQELQFQIIQSLLIRRSTLSFAGIESDVAQVSWAKSSVPHCWVIQTAELYRRPGERRWDLPV
jgi:hypothetical protein